MERHGNWRMLFKKASELKVGMRLARPIYNKEGVLLYERDSKLTKQGIESINNIGFLGIYILEPAEPVPPMTAADIDFERFQTMCVFSIKEEMAKIVKNKRAAKVKMIASNILKNYGKLDEKINFIQNLRSKDDYIYKHTLNVALLCAMLSSKMNLKMEERQQLVMAALVYEIGDLQQSTNPLPESPSLTSTQREKQIRTRGNELIKLVFPHDALLRTICLQVQKVMDNQKNNQRTKGLDKLHLASKIMVLAKNFDHMTAMRENEKPVSEVYAIKHFLQNKEDYDRSVVGALIDSINILVPGVSIELNTRDKAIVLEENTRNILRPIILGYHDNIVIDLSKEFLYKDLEIVDIMKTMDNRHVMDIELLRERGYHVKEPEYVPVSIQE